MHSDTLHLTFENIQILQWVTPEKAKSKCHQLTKRPLLCLFSFHRIWLERTHKDHGSPTPGPAHDHPRLTPHSQENSPPQVCKVWSPMFYKFLSCPIQSHSYIYIQKMFSISIRILLQLSCQPLQHIKEDYKEIITNHWDYCKRQ